jgi:hypothetical protein
LARLWVNWGQRYPVRSSAVAIAIAITLWWGFGLLLWLSDRKEPSTTEKQDSHVNQPRDDAARSATTAPPHVSPSPNVPTWPTVHDHFASDFAESKEFGAIWGSGMNIELPNQTTLTAEARLHWAFTSRAKFMSFYIPRTDYTYFAAQAVAEECWRILKEIENARFTARDPAEPIPYDSADLQFTGQVFLYYEGNLSLEQLASLKQEFNAHNLYPNSVGRRMLQRVTFRPRPRRRPNANNTKPTFYHTSSAVASTTQTTLC